MTEFWRPRTGYGQGTYAKAGNTPAAEDDLRRIADALERIADAVAGPAVQEPRPVYPEFPIIGYTDAGDLEQMPTTPFIGHMDGRLLWAVCIYCPAKRDVAVDPGDPLTWMDHADSGYDLDEQRAALVRHLAHHAQQDDPTAPLAVWTWQEQTCPRCHVVPGQPCQTTSGRKGTAIHSARWRDHSDGLW